MRSILPALILILLASSIKLPAQISQGGTPYGFKTGYTETEIDLITLNPPDRQIVAAEDEEYLKNARPYRIGINLPVNRNMENSGVWTNLPDNSGSIWRLHIKAEGANGLNIRFDDFYLPSGAKLFIYNEDHSHVLGAYTEVNNNDDGSFATEALRGETAVLELYQPNDMTGKARMSISNVAWIYRGLSAVLNPQKASGACEVNIACSEGNNWQDEKKGVVLVETVIGGGTFICSGSAMNNTRGDCTPYILLADHCAFDASYASTSDLNSWVFYFHYESTTCSGTSPSGVKTMTGCTLKAHDTYGSNNNGSDFYLVQLKTAIPSSHNVYFNGWSRSTSPSSSGVSIHHPDGDIKKISTYSSPLTSISVGGTGSHWEVTWVTTANGHGVTEGGSSGSPIFNSTGLVVGTLTGGSSFCTAPNDPDYYGKFSQHWTSNGSTSAKQLKPWLDPLNTNPTTLNGTYTCTSSIDETNNQGTEINLFPNPTTGKITLTLNNHLNGPARVAIFNIMGQQISDNFIMNANEKEMMLDISGFGAGIYYVGIAAEGNLSTKKIILIED